MTFIDKKIEELEKKFSLDCSLVNNKARISISGLLDLKSWLRQTIAEAESNKFKEGQEKAYNSVIENCNHQHGEGKFLSTIEFLDKKLKELEAGK